MSKQAGALIDTAVRRHGARGSRAALVSLPAVRPWWKRLSRNRNIIIGLLIVGALAFSAVFAPWLAPHDPTLNDLAHALRPPRSPGFPLGTDNLGRDVLSRVIWGSRISLTVGVVVQIMAIFLGTLLGLLAGFYRGRADDAVSAITNVMFALPRLLFAMAIVAALGPSIVNLFIALGMVGWPAICRLVRAETLSLCGKDFVEGARAVGATDLRIITRHILPNALSPIIVLGTLGMAHTILAEASLSFLGFGVQPPMASWGSMMSRGQAYIWHAPWLMLYPGLAIFITVVGLNLLGDGLRDALDPRLRR
jgi:peptide/nickel transport system permease protein